MSFKVRITFIAPNKKIINITFKINSYSIGSKIV